jgi:hypothetical protein
MSNSSHAALSWVTSTVKWVYPQNDGSFVLAFTNDASTCTNTGVPKYFIVAAGFNAVTLEGVKAMLTTALTAYSTGSTLTVAFDDATSNCYINRFAMM